METWRTRWMNDATTNTDVMEWHMEQHRLSRWQINHIRSISYVPVYILL